MLRTTCVVAAAVLMGACARAPEEDTRGPAATRAPSVGATVAGPVTTASGLEYIDLRVGRDAKAEVGKVAVIHHSCSLPDGIKIDGSRERGRALQFRVGDGTVVKGWEEGVVGMQVGGIRKLTIPPAIGYGAEGYEDLVPPNATLICEIQLLAVQ
jgi:FKBP-type peptidyl-prolyl cis-trans isomerase